MENKDDDEARHAAEVAAKITERGMAPAQRDALRQVFDYGLRPEPRVNDEDPVAVVAFTVRLPYKVHKDLRRICLEHDLTINGQINTMISNYLEEHDACAACN